jgi:hypothetical protein
VVTKHHLNLLNELYETVSNSKIDEKNKVRFEKIQSECNRVANEHGKILNKLTRIQRKEMEHFIFEDGDFCYYKDINKTRRAGR